MNELYNYYLKKSQAIVTQNGSGWCNNYNKKNNFIRKQNEGNKGGLGKI